eukprot:TRINITY_DN14629_c0_g1_i1.p1 TRINITY_DN14629_c0_g1~~TRINITY_DN14629_c0_g1_i1.p1  ORF type:complete len:263 (+),score=35.28 TRINITY_DN14629_c0_g1_i1:40-828(+)
MPELADVELFRHVAERACVGKIVQVIDAIDDKIWKSDARAVGCLTGKRIMAVLRHGKYLWFAFESPSPQLLLHFGLSGTLTVYGSSALRPSTCKLGIILDDGICVSITTSRHLGVIKLCSNVSTEPLIAKLGADVLTSLPHLTEFQRLLQSRHLALKTALIDQSVLAGLGNWMGDEVCFQAKLDPRRFTNELDAAQSVSLYDAINMVVSISVQCQLSAQSYPSSWLYHRRYSRERGDTGPAAGIEVLDIGGKFTSYDATVQM